MSTSPGSTLWATEAFRLEPAGGPGLVLAPGMDCAPAEADGDGPPEPRSANTAPAPTAAASTATTM
jgi:hypothetical protein